MDMKYRLGALLIMVFSCKSRETDVQKDTEYSLSNIQKTLENLPHTRPNIPRNVTDESGRWKYIDYKDWTSGFWPGTLWYAYETSGNEMFKIAADSFSRQLTPLSHEPAFDHDLGFQVFNSFGHGYRLTGNPEYKRVILATADTLATLYNPKVGTLLSWPREVPGVDWPRRHNTIMDNMINLELLFWASKNGGRKELYDIAVSHAEKTMKYQFRPDHTSFHVVVYDKDNGHAVKQITHQGYNDQSMWARGQAWAIYGYTMVYRETRDPKFLDFAQKVTDVYLGKLPEDLVPFWDFDDPAIPNAPKDASAAAIVASALLELSTLTQDKELGKTYRNKAEGMLRSLSDHYHTKGKNTALLAQVTGHKPNGSEINASINYADYYYLEALLRYKNLKK